MRHRIRALAEQLEVRMLIIDEIHALLNGTPRLQRIILTAIRLLANDLRIPLVCVGIEEANRALMTDDQLADRFAAAELPAWENDEAFEQLLLSFESTLPLRQPSDFRDPKVRQRILSLTQGVLGRVCRLIETAAVEAIRSGEERITLALLKEELVTESLCRLRIGKHAASRGKYDSRAGEVSVRSAPILQRVTVFLVAAGCRSQFGFSPRALRRFSEPLRANSEQRPHRLRHFG